MKVPIKKKKVVSTDPKIYKTFVLMIQKYEILIDLTVSL